jgi:uncharacterized protein involved in high-affinity Fe2+ transport
MLLPPSSGPLMMAASTSETSVNFYHITRRNSPEDTVVCFAPVVALDGPAYGLIEKKIFV